MNPLKWKVWGGIGTLIVGALLYLKGRLDRERSKNAALQHRVASVEKRSAHTVAMAEADREGALEAAETVEKAVENAKTDNDWSRFTK